MPLSLCCQVLDIPELEEEGKEDLSRVVGAQDSCITKRYAQHAEHPIMVTVAVSSSSIWLYCIFEGA
jgi:hypothetical protein